MFFSIDPHNGVAIYEQLVRQVKFGVAEGTLRPGQLLPSARVLSQQLAINPNTINRAFQQLQAEGVLESVRGKGLAVCVRSLAACRKARQTLLEQRIREVLSEALHAGLPSDEVRELFLQQLKELNGRVATVSSTGSEEISERVQ
ncbi:MAG: GntR family transcriptional regulator [Planctomycetaceae bacterium]|nr:GntR family transcriptional regulator [Planctomycetaceae bacterium]